jgi:hypothetical protein
MVNAAAALKEIDRAMDVIKPTGIASGIKLPTISRQACANYSEKRFPPRSPTDSVSRAYL